MKAFSYNHPEINFKSDITILEASSKSIEDLNNTASLRGIKGNAARAYFSSFEKMLLGVFTFKGRISIPPPTL